MLIRPTAYEPLNHNVILYTKAENISSLAYGVSPENGNDPQVGNEDEEADNSREDKSEDHEINDFGEREQAKNENDESEGRMRKSFSRIAKS